LKNIIIIVGKVYGTVQVFQKVLVRTVMSKTSSSKKTLCIRAIFLQMWCSSHLAQNTSHSSDINPMSEHSEVE